MAKFDFVRQRASENNLRIDETQLPYCTTGGDAFPRRTMTKCFSEKMGITTCV